MPTPLLAALTDQRRRRSPFTRIDDADRGSGVVEYFENRDRVSVGDQRDLEQSGAQAAVALLDFWSIAVTVPRERVTGVLLPGRRVQDEPGRPVRLGKQGNPTLGAKDGRFIGSVDRCGRPQLRSWVATVHPLHRDGLIGSRRRERADGTHLIR